LREFLFLYSEHNSTALCRRYRVMDADGVRYPTPCRNKFSCPSCSAYYLEQDRKKILKLLDAHEHVVFITLTLPTGHHAGTAMSHLGRVWHKTFNVGSWWRDFQDRHGIAGRVRVVEWSFGRKTRNETSAHIHLLLVGNEKLAVEAGNLLALRWAQKAVSLGLDASLTGQDARMVPKGDDRARVAGYVTKQSATQRSAPASGRTPGDLLNSAATTGDADDLAALQDFHNAVHGRHKVQISSQRSSDQYAQKAELLARGADST
jgi:hypothetical protein